MPSYKPFRDRDYTPWSFVWPVATGVMLGVLLADLVRVVVGAVLAGALLSSWSDNLEKRQTTPGHLPARPGQVVQQPRRSSSSSPQVPVLDGPRTARSKDEITACVAGYIAYDEGNGWTQHTNGGRRQCTARSP